MTIYLTRDDCDTHRSLGTMTFPEDGDLPQFICQTLEDPVRPEGVKIYGDTAIPSGVYRVTITRSKRFNKLLPLLHAVPGFGGVRIHSGNGTGDTSGCPLVGMERNPSPDSALLILRSREAMDHVQPRIAAVLARGEDVWLDIATASVTTDAVYEVQSVSDATGDSSSVTDDYPGKLLGYRPG